MICIIVDISQVFTNSQKETLLHNFESLAEPERILNSIYALAERSEFHLYNVLEVNCSDPAMNETAVALTA